jgi:peroxiredoxin
VSSINRRAAIGGTLAAVLLLSGCSSAANSISSQANQGDNKGYIAGNGLVDLLTASKRAKPVSLSGTTLTGQPWSTSDAAGKIVVINVWGSWCPPCDGEMDDLQKAYTQLKGQDVVFMGIDIKESAATGEAFTKSKGVTYPSLSDPGSETLAALQGKATATPVTLVLDAQHRIAGRVSGPVDATTLVGMVQDIKTGNFK